MWILRIGSLITKNEKFSVLVNRTPALHKRRFLHPINTKSEPGLFSGSLFCNLIIHLDIRGGELCSVSQEDIVQFTQDDG